MTRDTHRRTFLKGVGVTAGVGATVGTASAESTPSEQHESNTAGVSVNGDTVKIGGITTVYRPNSHSDVQLGSLIQGFGLDGKDGRFSSVELASLYTDQLHENDLSRDLARRYLFPIYDTVEGALKLGTGDLAVDAVYLCLEHGDYPKSPTGNTEYPKRRIFEAVVDVFEETGESVPVFMDKHVSDNWEDAKWIYDKSQELDFPMMAGSSLPVSWRTPGTNAQTLPDVEQGRPLEEAVAVSRSSLDGSSFHALEFLQSLVERREGGETGIEAVQALEGDAVWDAGETGVYDRELLFAALNRDSSRHWFADDWKELKSLVDNPVIWIMDYADGLRASVLTITGAVSNWSASWRYDEPDGEVGSSQSDLQNSRPFAHHGLLVENVMQMFETGEPVYPVERTLLVSGALNQLLTSLNLEDGKRIETPHLDVSYQTDWTWEMPNPRPPGRTVAEDFPPNFPWHIPISFGDAGDVVDARYDEGNLPNGQYHQLTAHLSTADRMAKQGKPDQANRALERFISTASTVGDEQTATDLVEMAENLQEHRVPELNEILS